MNYLSLFSGIGGFDLGFDRAGMNCIGQCEIDKHASNVLRRHWPKVERIEDVRTITRATFDVRPNLICGGFPCQDLSVAGKRRGLAGGRSGLWFEYRRIIDELKPEWVVVENVPGLFSSNGGRDFAVLLRGLEELGYMGIWKTLDSRYFGVAQRRRRVFVIANLGGRGLAQILFESQSLRRNPSKSRKVGQEVAGTLSNRSKGGGGLGTDFECGGGLVVPPLTSKMAKGTGGPSGDECQNLVIARESGKGYWMEDDKAGTIHGCRPSNVVAFNLRGRQGGAMPEMSNKASVRASCGGSSRSYISQYGVRRLTPTECERLQGFPDDWTKYAVKPDGTVYEQSDSQRYRQLGNAVTATVGEWIGNRITETLK